MNDEKAAPPARKPGGRLESLGYGGTRLKPQVLKTLSPKMLRLIDAMVNGVDSTSVCQLTREVQDIHPETGEAIKVTRPIERGTALTLIEAADFLGIKRRQARDLFGQALFQKELGRAIQALKDGHKAEAVHKQIEIMRDPGARKAADRKVQLEAAREILGEGEKRQGTSVNINVGPTLVPGYVIRLPAKREPPTIEGEAVHKPASVVELRPDSRGVPGTWPPRDDPPEAA